jgi:hypothetical protein
VDVSAAFVAQREAAEAMRQARVTKAGKAQMAKQGAPTASKLAAKRVDTKRQQ